MSNSSVASDKFIEARGRFVGQTLYWDIGDETIDDKSFRKWCWQNLPEPWNHVGTTIVAWQTTAFARRRKAIKEAMR